MFSLKEAIKSPDYWHSVVQIDLYKKVIAYLENAQKSKGELAAEMGVSNSYISQILNGNFNFTLKKLFEICIHIGIVPVIKFVPIKDIIEMREAEQNIQKQDMPLLQETETKEKYSQQPTYTP